MSSTVKHIILCLSVIFVISCAENTENLVPTCKITNLENNDEIEIGRIYTISVEAKDLDGEIVEVTLHIDDTFFASLKMPPYNFEWEIPNGKPGRIFIVIATSIDNNGGKASNGKIVYSTEIVQDYEGNTYKATTIGDQIWFTENLKSTKYNDGDNLPLLSDMKLWRGGNYSSPAYNWYNFDEDSYNNPYGPLYNWYAVETGKLCPTGWHIPTDEEWTELVNSLGGSTVAGSKMKEAGTVHWTAPNVDATNDSKFTALPAGSLRGNDGVFTSGIHGNYWSATDSTADLALYRRLINESKQIYRDGAVKNIGFSVRCVKD